MQTISTWPLIPELCETYVVYKHIDKNMDLRHTKCVKQTANF